MVALALGIKSELGGSFNQSSTAKLVERNSGKELVEASSLGIKSELGGSFTHPSNDQTTFYTSSIVSCDGIIDFDFIHPSIIAPIRPASTTDPPFTLI